MGEVHAKLRECLALKGAGDLPGALRAAQEAAAAAPGSAVPLYAQGEILAAMHDDAAAARAYADALRHAPGWADAWINFGLAQYRQGAVGDAKTAMREALAVSPGHPAATANLAALMRITGGAREAEAMLRENLKTAPDNITGRLNLASSWVRLSRGAEALALLDAAPAPQDEALRRLWHLSRAAAGLQQGRLDVAREAIAAIAALAPTPPALLPLLLWRQLRLAELERDTDRAAALAREMAAAIVDMGPDATPEHRIMAHYDLAAYFSRARDADQAFAHWSAAHVLLRQSQPFERATLARFVEDAIARFDAARFSAAARATNADPAPVFIVGMPRSGTTLCEQILSAHRNVHGAGERMALSEMASQLGGVPWAESNQRLAALDGAALDDAADEYLTALHALAPDKTRIVDKMPGNELHLGLAGLMLPGARIIHCVRDPRDIGFSIWTFRFHGDHGYAHDLADLGWTIGQRARLMAHWRKTLPNPILTVALADWVRDFEATLRRVLDFLGLPPDPACARFYESDREIETVSREQVRQPIHARGIGRWRPFAKHLAPLIAELEAEGLLRPPAA